MPERIIQVSKETLEKRIREGKITFPGDPTNPSPIEGKPAEITTSVNTGRVIPAKKGIGRRKFLMKGTMTLVGLTLTGIGVAAYDETTKDVAYETILHTPLTSDDLPEGWVRTYAQSLGDRKNHSSRFLESFTYTRDSSFVTFNIKRTGEPDPLPSNVRSNISFTICNNYGSASSQEYAQIQFGIYKKGRNSGWLVNGIGDMVFVDPPDRACLAVVDRIFIQVDVVESKDEQTLLDLTKSSINYLARIGVTSKKP